MNTDFHQKSCPCFYCAVNERDRYKAALDRLSSPQGFVAIGFIPDDQWGNELRVRMSYAENALHGSEIPTKPNVREVKVPPDYRPGCICASGFDLTIKCPVH